VHGAGDGSSGGSAATVNVLLRLLRPATAADAAPPGAAETREAATAAGMRGSGKQGEEAGGAGAEGPPGWGCSKWFAPGASAWWRCAIHRRPDVNDCCLEVAYMATQAGEYAIELFIGGERAPPQPRSLVVLPAAACARASLAWGDGLRGATAGAGLRHGPLAV
jgi:hypothetical protein